MKEKIYPLYVELSEQDYSRLLKIKQRLGERTKVGVIRYLLRKFEESEKDGATV